jgi:5-methylcytosine-specific restriction endonuclease McrA
MIRIDKPDDAPDVLQEKGPDQVEEHRDAIGRGEHLKSGDFKRSIYTDDAVKQALIEAQHHKCGFCESKITHVIYGGGDVEHFRPKTGYRQNLDDDLQRPGYYWLAYEWTNLFLACPVCNRRFKRDLFPLQNPDERAPGNHEDESREEPVFLHPGEDDPEAHIGFRKAVAFARNGSRRGALTIRSLGLNRDALYEVRRDHFVENVQALLTLLRAMRSSRTTEREKEQARRHFRNILNEKRRQAERDRTEYASMLRDAIRRLDEAAREREG